MLAKRLVLLCIAIGIGLCSRATHLSGADLTYKCIGGNTYEVTLSYYWNCSGAANPLNATILYCSNSCNSTNNQVILLPDSGVIINSFCAPTNNWCVNGPDPGIKKFVYSGTLTLPQQCDDWILTFQACCREMSTTLVGSSQQMAKAKIDNLNVTCNNSPSFNMDPALFVCCNQLYSYDQGATDIDGDSLVYSFYTPMAQKISCDSEVIATYNFPYDSAQFLTSAPPITYNQNNGFLKLNPTNCNELGSVAIRVDEYRNGNHIGSITRDNLVFLIDSFIPGNVNESILKQDLLLFPNPTTGKFRVESLELGVGEVLVYDLLGNLVLRTKEKEIDLSLYQAGIYFIKVGELTEKVILSR